MTLYFWNDGSPTKAKVTGGGNKQRLKLPSGVVLTGKVEPDPYHDLYQYTEVGPVPNEYQQPGSVSYDNDGYTITATRTVVDQPLDRVKDRLKRKVKAIRDNVVNAGIEFQAASGDPVYVVQTDADSRRELTGAVVAANEDNLTVQAWRMADNEVVVMDIADFKAMALEVRNHVNACFERQAALEAEIDAADDVGTAVAIDLDAGWPETS